MPILTTRVLLIRSSNVKHINQQVYDDALIDEKRLCYDTAVIAADVPRLQATREAVQAGLEQAAPPREWLATSFGTGCMEPPSRIHAK